MTRTTFSDGHLLTGADCNLFAQSGQDETFLTVKTDPGTAALPAYSFALDPDSGMWRPAANTLAWSTGGAERMRLDASGNLGLGVTPSAWSNYKSFQFGYTGALSNHVALNYLRLESNSYNGGGGLAYLQNGYATAYTQNNGAHTWYTAPSGTAGNPITFTQVLAIEKDKSLALQGATSQTGTGISFPSTQVASSDSNTLDDYEEGTWTPIIVGTTTTGSGTYSTQKGTYTKVGRKVSFKCYVSWSAHTGTGNLELQGIPFTADSTAGTYSPLIAYMDEAVTLTAGSVMQAYVIPSTTRVFLGQYASGGGSSISIPMDTAGAILISGHYEI